MTAMANDPLAPKSNTNHSNDSASVKDAISKQKLALRAWLIACLAALMSGRLIADEGSGGAHIATSGIVLGQTATVTWGHPSGAFSPTVLAVSDGIGPSSVLGAGTVCLDVTSPAFMIVYVGFLDATGQAMLSFPIPNMPSLATLPPIYVTAAVAPSGVLSLTRTVRMEFDAIDTYKSVQNLAVPRILHTATAIDDSPFSRDPRVLIAGGSDGPFYALGDITDTTEIFDPLRRIFVPGPSMCVPRVLHQATRLDDGRILISGGTTPSGLATNSCEIFDPAVDALVPAAPMNMPRAWHMATLLFDGRVLVTGGGTIFGGAFSLAQSLNSTLPSAEIYDPSTSTWTLVSMGGPFMLGHAQIRKNDGTVFIAAGWSTSTSPSYSTLSFDPQTNSFAFLGVGPCGLGTTLTSRTPFEIIESIGGIALISSYNTTPPTYFMLPLDGYARYTGNQWQFFGLGSVTLGYPIAFHTATVQHSPVGDFVQVHGGGGADCGTHRVMFNPLGALGHIGTNPNTGVTQPTGLVYHTLTRMADGSFLLAGGRSNQVIPVVFPPNSWASLCGGLMPSALAWVYTPPY